MEGASPIPTGGAPSTFALPHPPPFIPSAPLSAVPTLITDSGPIHRTPACPPPQLHLRVLS